MDDLRDRLNQLMASRNVSQAEMSRRTGITTAGISKYCTGQSEPTLSNAALIADALDIPLDMLAGRRGYSDSIDPSTIRLLGIYITLDARGRTAVESVAASMLSTIPTA